MKAVLDKELKGVPYMFISSVAQQGLVELKDKLWQMLNV
jgi:GTP-binding protein